MPNKSRSYTRIFTTLIVTCVVAAFTAQPAAAQSAKKLKCTGCVKSKQIKNSGIKGADIKAGTIDGSKLKNDTIDGGKIGSGAVGTDEIEDGSIGEVDLGFSAATAGDVGLLMTKIDNLAHLQASGASAYVFVTSETYTGNLGGVAGADEKCQTLADAAGLPGIYLAWIADSDPATAPASRFTQAPKAYILPPGDAPTASAAVADSWADLTVGSLAAPIDVTEEGQDTVGTKTIWTNVGVTGLQSSPNQHCNDWLSSSAAFTGQYGSSASTNVNWTAAGILSLDCDLEFRLYCFGQ